MYKTLNDGYILRTSDLAQIAPTMESPEYRQYLVDVANGATVEPFDYAAEDARVAAAAAVKLASDAKVAKDLSAKQEAQADAITQYLATHTPLENYQYVQNQVNVAGVTSLATAKAAIDELAKITGKLAAVVGVLARDLG